MNRADCCGKRINNAKVFVGHKLCGVIRNPRQGAWINVNCRARGNFVKIVGAPRQYLHFCGIRVWGFGGRHVVIRRRTVRRHFGLIRGPRRGRGRLPTRTTRRRTTTRRTINRRRGPLPAPRPKRPVKVITRPGGKVVKMKRGKGGSIIKTSTRPGGKRVKVTRKRGGRTVKVTTQKGGNKVKVSKRPGKKVKKIVKPGGTKVKVTKSRHRKVKVIRKRGGEKIRVIRRPGRRIRIIRRPGGRTVRIIRRRGRRIYISKNPKSG